MLAIATGLVIGKPLGLVSGSVLAVWLAVFAASILSAAIGVAVLWSARRDEPAAGAGPS